MHRIRFKNLFIIIFTSYIIVLIIPIIMTGVIYFKSENVLQEQLVSSNFAVLNQTRKSVDDRLHEIDSLSNQILGNQRVNKLMYKNESVTPSNMLLFEDLLKDFSSYKNIMPFVDDFFVYFYSMDYMVTSVNSAEPKFYYESFFERGSSYPEWEQQVLHTVHYGDYTRSNINLSRIQPLDMMIFLKSTPDMVNGMPLANIGIMVDVDKFSQQLAGVERIGGAAYIVSDGKVVFTSGNAANEQFKIDENLLNDEQGVFTQKIGGEEYVISYVTSEKCDWKYVTSFSKDIIQAKINYMRQFAVIAIYICVSFALIIILLLTYKNYKPITNIAGQFEGYLLDVGKVDAYQYIQDSVKLITDKNKEFNATMESNKPLFKANLLTKLIKGYAFDSPTLDDTLMTYDIDFKYEEYAVILFHVEDCSRFIRDNSENERNFVRFVITNISEELANANYRGYTIEADGDMMCMVYNLPAMRPELLKQNLSRLVEQIKSEIEKHFKMVLTVSVGGVYGGHQGIHTSYAEAVRAMDYRMIQGVSSILYAADMAHTSSNYYYPPETENFIINYVRAGDFAQVEKLLNTLFDENFKNRHLSLSIGKCLFFDITSTAIKVLDLINVDYTEVFNKDFNPIQELLNCNTVYKSREKMLFIYRQLCDYIGTHKKSHNDQLRDSITAYIDTNYSDENLSQTVIAEHLGISPNYLSNFFREQMGEKMINYISNIRVLKAKELLKDTELSMSQIAKQVGFSSDLSLIRVFKKSEGLTPGQYRSQFHTSPGSEIDKNEKL